MKLIDILKRASSKFNTLLDKHRRVSIVKQQEFLHSLGEPKDNIERSFFQYKCQTYNYGKLYKFILYIFCAFFCIYIYIRYSSANRPRNLQKRKAVLFLNGGWDPNLIPKSITEEFGDVELHPEDGSYLSKQDKAFIIKIFKRYPFSVLLLLKTIIRVGSYSYKICKYQPNCIIAHSEGSFVCSILTEYCNINNIQHINVMHGDITKDFSFSFYNFNRAYVWNEYYKEISLCNKAEEHQFIIEIPPSLSFEKNNNTLKKFDIVYYLQDENKDVLIGISKCLKKLVNQGKKIAVRPHPRFSDLSLVKKYLSFMFLEDCKTVPIEVSIMRTNAVLSHTSTVLLQAYYNSVDVIIDDITDVSRYYWAIEQSQISTILPHKLLSCILNENE